MLRAIVELQRAADRASQLGGLRRGGERPVGLAGDLRGAGELTLELRRRRDRAMDSERCDDRQLTITRARMPYVTTKSAGHSPMLVSPNRRMISVSPASPIPAHPTTSGGRSRRTLLHAEMP